MHYLSKYKKSGIAANCIRISASGKEDGELEGPQNLLSSTDGPNDKWLHYNASKAWVNAEFVEYPETVDIEGMVLKKSETPLKFENDFVHYGGESYDCVQCRNTKSGAVYVVETDDLVERYVVCPRCLFKPQDATEELYSVHNVYHDSSHHFAKSVW